MCDVRVENAWMTTLKFKQIEINEHKHIANIPEKSNFLFQVIIEQRKKIIQNVYNLRLVGLMATLTAFARLRMK